MLKIGNTELKHGIMLAPMAGATDHAFRTVCRSFGAEYLVSEMVCAKALCYEQKIKKSLSASPSKTAPLAAIREGELPMAVQIFGSEPSFMAEAAKMIAENSYRGTTSLFTPTAIDINMGCPVPKVVSNGEGSALLKNPSLAAEIVSAVVKAVDIPVTVKIRTGWDKNSINAVEMAKRLEAAGAALICVHGRTREQQYAPYADWTQIAAVKKAVNIPVIGNGDIFTPNDAVKMMNETGCDGIMIGRGALGNPWIFENTVGLFEGRPIREIPQNEVIDVALSHLRLMIEDKGERAGVAESRKHLGWYMKGLRGAAELRNRINTAATLEELTELLLALRE
ncbi:MAG: tRNA dihydrouridine synthase DusB [Clostridia bacterium]|nr:tRNA dihydrouridine synthase DusB [Clostridia bacterium]